MGFLEDKRRARVFYKYLSRVYDRINPFIWTEEMRARALDMLDITDDAVVLDVGCGTGYATQALLTRTDHVHGLDQSTHQLERAWQKLGKHDPVSFYIGDAEHLPFRDGSFDVVWSSGSIEYWPNPVGTLAECRRVTRPGGQVLVVGPNHPDSRLLRGLADAIMLFYDQDEADRMFSEAGFECVEHQLMGPRYSPNIAIASRAIAPP